MIVTILLLFSAWPHLMSNVTTWAGGVTAVTVLFTVLAGFVEGHEHPPGWVTWVRVVRGLGLPFIAIRQLLGRTTKPAPPSWH